MPVPPDFSVKTVIALGFRSGLICNNPECSTITVGPAEVHGPLATKIGEAAHIHAARKGEARYNKAMTDKERADISNGIWLCASCHTMIDKNEGTGFPAVEIFKWKSIHESIIQSLLLTHRSPLGILRKFTEEGRFAQEVVDVLQQHGAFFVIMDYEIPVYVESSIDEVRKKLGTIIRKITYDKDLKATVNAILTECRTYMNQTGVLPQHRRSKLQSLRDTIGFHLKRLRDNYGCHISGGLEEIVP